MKHEASRILPEYWDSIEEIPAEIMVTATIKDLELTKEELIAQGFEVNQHSASKPMRPEELLQYASKGFYWIKQWDNGFSSWGEKASDIKVFLNECYNNFRQIVKNGEYSDRVLGYYRKYSRIRLTKNAHLYVSQTSNT